MNYVIWSRFPLSFEISKIHKRFISNDCGGNYKLLFKTLGILTFSSTYILNALKFVKIPFLNYREDHEYETRNRLSRP